MQADDDEFELNLEELSDTVRRAIGKYFVINIITTAVLYIAIA